MDDDKPFRPAKYKTATVAPVPTSDGSSDLMLRQIVSLERAIRALTAILSAQKPQEAQDIRYELTPVLDALRSLKLDPQVNVQAPDVNVPAIDLTPLKEAISELNTEVSFPESLDTKQTNVFIDEKFDEYKVEYYDDDDDLPVATNYFLNGKRVARVEYKYNSTGNLVGARKV